METLVEELAIEILLLGDGVVVRELVFEAVLFLVVLVVFIGFEEL